MHSRFFSFLFRNSLKQYKVGQPGQTAPEQASKQKHILPRSNMAPCAACCSDKLPPLSACRVIHSWAVLRAGGGKKNSRAFSNRAEIGSFSALFRSHTSLGQKGGKQSFSLTPPLPHGCDVRKLKRTNKLFPERNLAHSAVVRGTVVMIVEYSSSGKFFDTSIMRMNLNVDDLSRMVHSHGNSKLIGV